MSLVYRRVLAGDDARKKEREGKRKNLLLLLLCSPFQHLLDCDVKKLKARQGVSDGQYLGTEALDKEDSDRRLLSVRERHV